MSKAAMEGTVQDTPYDTPYVLLKKFADVFRLLEK